MWAYHVKAAVVVWYRSACAGRENRTTSATDFPFLAHAYQPQNPATCRAGVRPPPDGVGTSSPQGPSPVRTPPPPALSARDGAGVAHHAAASAANHPLAAAQNAQQGWKAGARAGACAATAKRRPVSTVESRPQSFARPLSRPCLPKHRPLGHKSSKAGSWYLSIEPL